MGTSRATQAPRTTKRNQVISSLKAPERNAAAVVDITFSVAIHTLPTVNPVAVPIVYGISEGLRFADDVKKRGIDVAVKKEALRLSDQYVVPSISNSLWDVAASRMDPKFTNSSFGRLAEQAFKKTMNQVLSKGAKARVEESE
jgi:hypothetical protein